MYERFIFSSIGFIAPFTHTKFYELSRPNLGERDSLFQWSELSRDKLEPPPEVELTFISQLSRPNLARCDNLNTLISDSNLSLAGLYKFNWPPVKMTCWLVYRIILNRSIYFRSKQKCRIGNGQPKLVRPKGTKRCVMVLVSEHSIGVNTGINFNSTVIRCVNGAYYISALENARKLISIRDGPFDIRGGGAGIFFKKTH